MLSRDIRNLVGRAGRAGSSTKGLVICANPNQWDDILPVATGQPGEIVRGAMHELLERLQNAMRQNGRPLTNLVLESNHPLFPLVDGIDANLMELLHEEIGAEQYGEIAASLAAETFAARQLDATGQRLLSEVFRLRADRIVELRSAGHARWVRETGARVRLVDSVIDDLAPKLSDWDTIESPLDPRLLDAVLEWAYKQRDFERDLLEAFRSDVPPPIAEVRQVAAAWIAGPSFAEIARELGYEIDTLLRIQSSVIAHALMTLVEQGIALLTYHMADTDRVLSPAVLNLPDHLRFGVPTAAARSMMATGMRHRRAAVALGNEPAMTSAENFFRAPYEVAQELLEDEQHWRATLGDFVFTRTVRDVRPRTTG
jgi:hypothetical protein